MMNSPPSAADGDVATVTVTRDTAGLTASVKGLVDAINGLLTDIDTQSAYNATTTKSGTLTGDANVRSLCTALLEAIYAADGTSMASYGIQVTRGGLIEFDATAFAQAYTADPKGVTERFSSTGNGFAARVAAVADGASDPTEGTITAAITGRRTGITRVENSIEEWDRRLELRRTALTRQFTALETALNQMSSQSSWLEGQLASLPSNNT